MTRGFHLLHNAVRLTHTRGATYKNTWLEALQNHINVMLHIVKTFLRGGTLFIFLLLCTILIPIPFNIYGYTGANGNFCLLILTVYLIKLCLQFNNVLSFFLPIMNTMADEFTLFLKGINIILINSEKTGTFLQGFVELVFLKPVTDILFIHFYITGYNIAYHWKNLGK